MDTDRQSTYTHTHLRMAETEHKMASGGDETNPTTEMLFLKKKNQNNNL